MLSLLSLATGTLTTLTLPLPPKFVAYASPFLFVYSDVLTIYDQFTLHALQQLALSPPLFLLDKDAHLSLPALRDGDATIHALLQAGSPFTAFDLLRRCQAAGNTVAPPAAADA